MLTKEKLQHHIDHLQLKHDELDSRIDADKEPEYIQTVLKKERLQLKREIELRKLQQSKLQV